MNDVLVIGFGNTLRKDDGAGRKAAELIAERYPGVESISVHELYPELAEQVAAKNMVVFLDAAVNTETVQLRPVSAPAEKPLSLSHAIGPEELLLLCRRLYDASPEGYLLRIPAFDLSHGESFSPRTHAAIEGCVGQVGNLLFGRHTHARPTGRVRSRFDTER